MYFSCVYDTGYSHFYWQGIRYGTHPSTIERWKKTIEIKVMFDKKECSSIYDLLPGVMENSLR